MKGEALQNVSLMSSFDQRLVQLKIKDQVITHNQSKLDYVHVFVFHGDKCIRKDIGCSRKRQEGLTVILSLTKKTLKPLIGTN